jgi:phospholipid transport system substrate-binding protein
MRPVYIVMFILLITAIPLKAGADTPTDTVKAYVGEVLNVLTSRTDEDSKKVEIRKIAGRMFDFTSMSKATLGRNWKRLNDKERKEFVSLLRKILENAYISKILGYTNEKAVFLKERPLSSTRVEVQSNLITANAEIPMHYRVLNSHGQWKTYDVIIEGVSLIKNYRTQFREILSKQSPEELLKVMRDKAGAI